MGCPNDFLMTEIQVTLPMFSEIRDWNQIKALHIGPGHVLSLDQVPITLFFKTRLNPLTFSLRYPVANPITNTIQIFRILVSHQRLKG